MLSKIHTRQHNPLVHNRTTFQSPWKLHNHVEGFNNLVKYIVRLRREGEIDDETFIELIKLSTSNFIENEITERVDRVLEEKLPINRLLDLL